MMVKNMEKDMERKVTKIGNSYGVTFPPEILEFMNVKHGESIVFKCTKNGEVIIKKRPAVNLEGFEDINQEFLEGMQELFAKYDDTLRNLAKR